MKPTLLGKHSMSSENSSTRKDSDSSDGEDEDSHVQDDKSEAGPGFKLYPRIRLATILNGKMNILCLSMSMMACTASCASNSIQEM